jgi:uncharacterized protein YdaT
MARKSTHVVPNSSGGWDVKQAGAQRASVHTQTKQDAVTRGREISRNQGTELVIHNKNGQISQCDSHGKDSFPPRG